MTFMLQDGDRRERDGSTPPSLPLRSLASRRVVSQSDRQSISGLGSRSGVGKGGKKRERGRDGTRPRARRRGAGCAFGHRRAATGVWNSASRVIPRSKEGSAASPAAFLFGFLCYSHIT